MTSIKSLCIQALVFSSLVGAGLTGYHLNGRGGDDQSSPKNLSDVLSRDTRSVFVAAMDEYLRQHPDQIESIAADYIAKHPEKIIESLNAYMAKEQKSKETADNAAVLEYRDQLLKSDGLPVIGNPDGKITITYFFDDNCPFCKAMSPILDEIVAKNPDVKIIHRAIPILMPSSEYAARAGFAVLKRWPDKYKAFHDALIPFKEGQMENEHIDQVLQTILGDADGKAAALMIRDDPDATYVEKAVRDNIDLMHDLGISGTPFIYVDNGGVFRGAVREDVVQAAVDKARKAAELQK